MRRETKVSRELKQDRILSRALDKMIREFFSKYMQDFKWNIP